MYKVQFVGMVCFYKQNGAKLALLPDGTQAQPTHTARIVVDPKSVDHSSGDWPNTKGEIARGDFLLDHDFDISIEQADQDGPRDFSKHRPVSLPSGFNIDLTTAQTIGRIPVKQGTLQTFRYPGTNDTVDASTITELTVEHEGTIRITAKTRPGGDIVRTIDLKPGTEIAVVNDSSDKSHDHFHIYEQIGTGAPLGDTPPSETGIFHRSQSHHRVFLKPDPIVEGVRCPNTGCC
jgi:hypothetical protein